MDKTTPTGIEKLATHIPGFDHIALGGLPKYRTTLVSGTAGSAKTVFAAQFLAEGITKSGKQGVFVTFEESPDDIRNNMSSMGWDIETWEREGKWLFVDASAAPGDAPVIAGSYDLGALLARIEHAITTIQADRVSLDSLDAIFTQLPDRAAVRRELLRIAATLKKMKVTAVMTAERIQEYGEISRFSVEEFVSDNVVILRNVLIEEKRRRTLEILKFRGADHKKGGHPFTVVRGEGLVVIPLSAIELKQNSSNIRVSSGNTELDAMCGGGIFRDSIILVSGNTGTGKTVLASEFMAGGLKAGERTLLFAFEESREQLFRNASDLAGHFEEMERDGMLKVICEYPEIMGLEDHLIKMNKTIRDFRPTRVAVDSISALERVTTEKGFREFVISLVYSIKQQQISALFTSTTPTQLGGSTITEAHISATTDSIILLRNVEMNGEMRRALTVLKMRGSQHDKNIREFFIDASGIHIGEPFRKVNGILLGRPVMDRSSEQGPEPE
ncbi:MAG: circadian clock protein KaiC [Desulfurivibrionaceae bacterium]